MAGGSVHAINVSNGGVPKRAVPRAYVGVDGVGGDRQRDLRYHGGRNRAVCLYSRELITALRAEGHPLAPGSIGENLTLEGIDWLRMVPGTRLQAGPVLLEVTAFAAPCRNLRGAFLDERFVRVSQKVHPGWSRLYARVIDEGEVETGAAATLLDLGI